MNGNWLRERRKRLEISQDDLAARLTVAGYEFSSKAISHWETGRHAPPLHDQSCRVALATALRMSVFELLLVAGYEVIPKSHTEDGERAAFIVDQLTLEQRELALRLLEQFLEKT